MDGLWQISKLQVDAQCMVNRWIGRLSQAGYQWMMDFLSLCVTVGILTSINKLYPLPFRGFDLAGKLLTVTDKTTQSSGQSVHDIMHN